jgi:hypothetical protein
MQSVSSVDKKTNERSEIKSSPEKIHQSVEK